MVRGIGNFLWVIALFVLAVAGTDARAGADEADSSEWAAIRAVIEQQRAAFAESDIDTAFDLVTPEFKSWFKTPAMFAAILENGYEPVYRPTRILFLDSGMVQGRPVQKVLAMDERGHSFFVFYVMGRDSAGNWRISGLRVFPLTDLPA